MLDVLLIWLGLDVAVLCIVLYDYWQWYGRTDPFFRAVSRLRASQATFRYLSILPKERQRYQLGADL